MRLPVFVKSPPPVASDDPASLTWTVPAFVTEVELSADPLSMVTLPATPPATLLARGPASVAVEPPETFNDPASLVNPPAFNVEPPETSTKAELFVKALRTPF